MPSVGRCKLLILSRVVYRFRMIYEVFPNEVRILAFLHGPRDFDRWLRSL